MLNNPLHNNPEREQRVRERAYHLWEADGKPHGRDVEFWERARELVAMEENGDAGRLPNPQNDSESVLETGVGVDEIQENLGEFPGRLAAHSEWQPTPTPAKSPRRRTPATAASAKATATSPKAPAASPKPPAATTRKPTSRGKKPRSP